MRRALLVWAVAFSFPAVAHAGSLHRWSWSKLPDDAKLRATIADMKRVVGEHPGVVKMEASDTSLLLVTLDEQAEEQGVFEFPGRTTDINVAVALAPAYDGVVSNCLAVARTHFTPNELRIARAPYEDRRDYAEGHYPGRYSPFGFGLWGLLYPVAMIALFYFMMGRARDSGASWGSYYLFWFIAPMVIAFFAQHPLVLLAIPVALVARRWLPDPYLIFKHSGRIRSLDAQVRANSSNVTARRDLAMIWLERRRPARALPLLEQALAQDPDSSELHFLHGVALVHARRWEEAVEPLIQACRLDPKLRYGEPYLRAADALMGLRRWEDADEALGHFLTVSRSSVEGWYKMALVRRARGDQKGAVEALDEAKQSYRDSPAFHRRRQLGWYLRALVRRSILR